MTFNSGITSLPSHEAPVARWFKPQVSLVNLGSSWSTQNITICYVLQFCYVLRRNTRWWEDFWFIKMFKLKANKMYWVECIGVQREGVL